MSAASVTLLISTPRTRKRAMEAQMVMGMVATATPATLSGSMSMTTMMTERMAMNISAMNPRKEWSTTWHWSLMMLMWTSSGSVASCSLIICFTFSPNSVMFFPGVICRERRMHFLPLLRMYCLGAGYSRRMLAMSPSLTTVPPGSDVTMVCARSFSVLSDDWMCMARLSWPSSMLPAYIVLVCPDSLLTTMAVLTPYIDNLSRSR